jgi:hypothetical protein
MGSINLRQVYNHQSLRLNGQLFITVLLMLLLSLSGGCGPKLIVPSDLPQEQRAHIRGTVGGSIFAGADIIAVDGETLSSANEAYILPGPHTVRLQYNRPGSGSIGPAELQFEAEAGHEYIAKWHYSWSKSIYSFSIEDAQTGNVVVSGGETPP